ncbi:MAG: hypothetical protein OXC40_02470 [Proteobacteria bacterium]|nr:hypothetical protein [Pseudomonadota bacterium]
MQQILTSLLIAIALTSCGVAGTADGLCKLDSCSNSKILPGNGKYEIQPLFEKTETTITCNSPTGFDISVPDSFRFKVIQKARTGGGEEKDSAGQEAQDIPVPGVRFNVQTNGGVFADETSPRCLPENDCGGDVLSAQKTDFSKNPRHKGLVTFYDGWCTDVCGVGLVEIGFRCVAPMLGSATGFVEIASGTVSYRFKITVTNNYEEEEEEATETTGEASAMGNFSLSAVGGVAKLLKTSQQIGRYFALLRSPLPFIRESLSRSWYDDFTQSSCPI